MSPSAYPGAEDPHGVDGTPTPWSRLATTQVQGNRRPRPSDLSRHEHGAVQDVERELREKARELLREAVASGIPASNAKIAIVVGATVELGAIRSRIEKANYERRKARLEQKA